MLDWLRLKVEESNETRNFERIGLELFKYNEMNVSPLTPKVKNKEIIQINENTDIVFTSLSTGLASVGKVNY